MHSRGARGDFARPNRLQPYCNNTCFVSGARTIPHARADGGQGLVNTSLALQMPTLSLATCTPGRHRTHVRFEAHSPTHQYFHRLSHSRDTLGLRKVAPPPDTWVDQASRPKIGANAQAPFFVFRYRVDAATRRAPATAHNELANGAAHATPLAATMPPCAGPPISRRRPIARLMSLA